MLMMTGLAFFLSAASIPGDPAPAANPEVKLALGYKGSATAKRWLATTCA